MTCPSGGGNIDVLVSIENGNPVFSQVSPHIANTSFNPEMRTLYVVGTGTYTLSFIAVDLEFEAPTFQSLINEVTFTEQNPERVVVTDAVTNCLFGECSFTLNVKGFGGIDPTIINNALPSPWQLEREEA